MPSPRRLLSSRAGLLLVEAALAAAIIAVGLVAISRTFGSALRTLKTAQQYETALRLAEHKLAELDSEAQDGQATPVFRSERHGTFDAPYEQFEWELTTREAQAADERTVGEHGVFVSWVTLDVTTPASTPPVRVVLNTLAPQEWIPPTWTEVSR